MSQTKRARVRLITYASIGKIAARVSTCVFLYLDLFRGFECVPMYRKTQIGMCSSVFLVVDDHMHV